ncbi:DUF4265 domain-containing protein [Luteimonas sp. RC10]|uniref:DUF4265 domain-containing protein n=1 Tax=Luteimonas sp. RC10 TaxID=2587035 RepID=UPI00161EDADD|nr:DUF4265 domain-containing protein [Luteimonas sp. RC10]MBB3344743.1 hypothetical protein [Luteimonas sp. RC10]
MNQSGDEMTRHQRIVFRLERDEDGYPPSDYERLWAKPLPGGNYLIDNIPFFVMGISAGDEVSVRNEDGELIFDRLIKRSGASTFRLIPVDPSDSEKFRADFEALGCSVECHRRLGLIAASVPEFAPIQPFLDYLVEGQEKGVFDVEEGALRHELAV